MRVVLTPLATPQVYDEPVTFKVNVNGETMSIKVSSRRRERES